MRTLLQVFMISLLASCSTSRLQEGDRLSPVWFMGAHPAYVKVGVYQGMDLYILNSEYNDAHNNSGLLVKNGIVMKDLNDLQLHFIVKEVRETNKSNANARYN